MKRSLVIKLVENYTIIVTAKYDSHHFTGYAEIAIQPFSDYEVIDPFCCHGKQTKRQITILFAILNPQPKQQIPN